MPHLVALNMQDAIDVVEDYMDDMWGPDDIEFSMAIEYTDISEEGLEPFANWTYWANDVCWRMMTNIEVEESDDGFISYFTVGCYTEGEVN